ncbi:MAG: DUF92 domain-containing protein [Gemmatimonadaceae bacterium]
MNSLPTWAIGLALASGVAIIARRAGALSGSGALAAAAIGSIAVGAGWSWGLLLIGYFVSSSALTRFRAGDKSARTDGRVEKGGRRDAAQVMANGGAFALAAVGWWCTADPVFQWLGAGALAASAADTWATEIGTLSRAAPRLVLSWRTVPAGTSGGVSVLGLLAALAGAAFVALLALALAWPRSAAMAAVAGGVAGMLLDSLIGATLQARHWCATCATDTEQRVHRCGQPTAHAGGIRWLGNDAVNALSTVGGALIGAAVAG